MAEKIVIVAAHASATNRLLAFPVNPNLNRHSNEFPQREVVFFSENGVKVP